MGFRRKVSKRARKGKKMVANRDIREKVQEAADIVSSVRVSLEWITNEIQDEDEAGLGRSVTFVSATALAKAEALLDEVLGEMEA